MNIRKKLSSCMLWLVICVFFGVPAHLLKRMTDDLTGVGKEREVLLAELSETERNSFNRFQNILRSELETGDVMVMQSKKDGSIFVRALQYRDKNGDLTFFESGSGAQVFLSPQDTAGMLQIFQQLLSIKTERNFHVPTTTKPSPPSAGEGFFFFK